MAHERSLLVATLVAAVAVLLAGSCDAALIEKTWTVTYKAIVPDGVEKVRKLLRFCDQARGSLYQPAYCDSKMWPLTLLSVPRIPSPNQGRPCGQQPVSRTNAGRKGR
jgi:hypothetical protein